MRYFYYKNEKVLGPVNIAELYEMYQQGDIDAFTLIASEEEGEEAEWIELGNVFDFEAQPLVKASCYFNPSLFRKAADLLIENGFINEETDLSAFFTGVMAEVMERFELEHRQPKKKRSYKMNTEGDEQFAEDLKQMNTKAGFEIQPVDIIIPGAKICITGQSDRHSRQFLYDKIVEAGGVASKTITLETNYLVVCDKTSKGYKYGTFGAKLKKAADYGITLVAEVDLVEKLKALNLIK
ncbi:BRCT domain-containing protein [Akkermansia biwaensis]